MSRRDLAFIMSKPGLKKFFEFVLQEIKRSGYDGLMPAGVVLTGGTSLLPGIRKLGTLMMLDLPVRVSLNQKIFLGLVDQLIFTRILYQCGIASLGSY